ncbi:hypothetical protein P8C59_001543 [Phyllachora maydis]|uniref:DNA polymerase kappa n=1 Tax=Phyllachora maydis TaxID=1825666 RepID=A0AAD9HZY8_9PEZI|nr:hypothetical protein P8C59_001543 [Phyllachora maydis]
MTDRPDAEANSKSGGHQSLKYSLLGPSLTKAGQDSVDQSKVSDIIYNASKGSKFFHREEQKDKVLTGKIDALVAKKRRLELGDPGLLARSLRTADALMADLELTRDLSQHIVHVDCDAFYAAVEQLDRPELADVPFAVGAGVLTTCNYRARAFGCRSGMAGFVAKKLCPQLLLIRPNFDKYTAKAREIRAVLARYDARFESASIDEAYLNITAYCAAHGLAPADAVAQLRADVGRATRVTVSAGLAPNARLAKICSNQNKPDGQFALPPDRQAVVAFLRDLPVRKVNGVGRVLERELAAVLGVHTCGDLYGVRAYLAPLFGDKAAGFLLRVHLGLGRTSVQPAEEHGRKSVGTESTFHDEADPAALRARLQAAAEELEGDLRRAECQGRTLALKVKLHTYEVLTRQVVTPKAVHRAQDLYANALPMLARLEKEVPGMKLRLMGLRCTNLVSTKKPDATAFFGLAVSAAGGPGTEAGVEGGGGGGGGVDTGLACDSDGWEQWPEDAMVPRYHGTELHSGPEAGGATGAEDKWPCPICGRPQLADERRFNDHIDLCLSRGTIRDAVRDAARAELGTRGKDASPPAEAEGTKKKSGKPRTGGEKKRGRPVAAAVDPKQKRLCFG